MPTNFRWFSFNGTGNPTLPTSYIYTPTLVASCSNTIVKKVCQIYSLYSTSGPILSSALLTYISNAVSVGGPQPSPTAPAIKKYVYVRPT